MSNSMRAAPEPFTAEQLRGAKELRSQLAHILPATFNTEFFLARWYRAYNGDAAAIEQRLRLLVKHRQALGYDVNNVVECTESFDFASKCFERFAISQLNIDVFSDDVAVFLQKMKGVSIKDIMKVIPLGHVLNSYFLLQECFHRAMHAYETRTGRPSAAVVVIDLDGLVVSDFLNPFSVSSKLAKYVVKIWSEYFSENLIRLYLLNPPALVSVMWEITKHIVDAKTKSRIVFLTRLEDLHNYLAKEAIPIEFGGTRRDDSGYTTVPESCISAPKPVTPDDHFNEERFFATHGVPASAIPEWKNVTLKVDAPHNVDVECAAGQTLVWLFNAKQNIDFEVVRLADPTAEEDDATTVWPQVTLVTLITPENGFLKVTRSGTYRLRFTATAAGWLASAKICYKIVCTK